ACTAFAMLTITGSAMAQTTIEGTGPQGGTWTKQRGFNNGQFNEDVQRVGPNGGAFNRQTVCAAGSCNSTWSGVTAKGRSYGGSGNTVFGPRGSTTVQQGTGPFGRTWQRKVTRKR
ncbi:MAG: hypothetical protein AAF940_01615, partial [Pseudomonadota bacterium]